MQKYVFFDVDGVLIKGQSQKYLLRYLFKKRKISVFLFTKLIIWFFFYKIGIFNNPKKIRNEAYKNFKGWDIAGTKKLFKDFFLEKIQPHLNKKAIDVLNKHLQNQDNVILISAALKDIVSLLGAHLGVKHCIASELKEENGKYAGVLQKVAPYGRDKIKRIKDFLGDDKNIFNNAWVYADHFSDIPLLELAKVSCVVNPDKKLYRYSKIKGWKIYKF